VSPYIPVAVLQQGAVWTTWTPTWTSTGTPPALVNGTVTARYVRIGNAVFCRFKYLVGSSDTLGTGIWEWTLPIAAQSSDVDYAGVAKLEDAGNAGYGPAAVRITASTSKFQFQTPLITTHVGSVYVVNAQVTSTIPFSWGTGDYIAGSFFYEAA
jgi:hypothetical protein